jgi:hypothetical protein
MVRRRLWFLVLCLGPLACRDAGEDRIGPVDLTQAPLTLSMTCAGTAALALEMPCRIGLALNSQDLNAVGIHAMECRLAQPERPLVWTSLFPLGHVRAAPSKPLQAPSSLRPVTGVGEQAIVLQGEREPATMSDVTGDLTFSKVDPTVRAFMGTFTGSVVWTSASGTQTSCQIDGPFWGAPGDFL